MTVMCELFFGIPQSAIRLGKIKRLSPVATKLYLALWYESERCSTRELTRTVAQLQELVGGSRNSYTKAIRELARAGLLSAESYGTEGFVFLLFDPETCKPWPLDPKVKPAYRRKGSTPPESSLTLPRPTGPSRISNTGTDFDFGHNQRHSTTTDSNLEQSRHSLTWDEIGKKRA
jgi:hypothetical protein